MSTQFLQAQKNQFFDIQFTRSLGKTLQRPSSFGFSSANYDISLIKRCFLPLPVNERGIELTVIKNANQFVSLKFGDVQLLDLLLFLGRATSSDSFLKAYKTSESTSYFPHEWCDGPEKLKNTQVLPYGTVFSKLRNVNPVEREYSVFQISIVGGLTSEEALSKLELKQPPATGHEN